MIPAGDPSVLFPGPELSTIPSPPAYPGGDESDELMNLVRWQVAFGPRYPGSDAHAKFRDALATHMGRFAPEVVRQAFSVPLLGARRDCENILGVFPASVPSSGESGRSGGALLIGTHFDSRIVADNERLTEDRIRPIPGANDGGSGTAILLHLAAELSALSGAGLLHREVRLALFDAEDVGHLDGNQFAAGAEAFAADPPLGMPAEVIALDMVGGRNMIFDVDAHIGHYRESFALTRSVFLLGNELGCHAFSTEKPSAYKYIVSDHAPFMVRGVPSCILIDIDYPEWHTQADLPEAMSGESLLLVRRVLLEYLRRSCVRE